MAVHGQFNAKSPTVKRILREASELASSPSPDYTATPQEDNLFEWHFTLRGPPGNSDDPEATTKGPYAEGIYHGRIVLPPTYPLRPPSFRFLTPSGRFETNREICLSISGHHEETWQPAWGLRTALVALRTFMETDSKGQLGGIECNEVQRRRYAKESQTWKCVSCAKANVDILKASEEAAKLQDAQTEVKVPEELQMGFKDEMGKKASKDTDDAESAELAEGFVTTTPALPHAPSTVPSASSGEITSSIVQGIESAASSPSHVAYRPSTGAVAAIRPRTQGVLANRPVSNEGVPAWIDKAIIGIAAMLITLILKLMLGY